MGMLRNLVSTGLFAMVVATTATASPYTQLVVFGDSLSDPGNASAMTGGLFPPAPPYTSSFSNGPTAAQYLAGSLGVTVQLGWPVPGGSSNNFAVGGALNGTGNYNVEINNPPGLGAAYPALKQTGIQRQVESYMGQQASVANPAQTLFLVWGGPNDMFLGAETGADPATFVPAALNALGNDLLMLAAIGAQHILVPGMPDLGLTPEARGLGAAAMAGLSALSAAYNGGLELLLDGLEQALDPLGVDFYGFDTAAYFARITADPMAFGFTNTNESCLYSGGPWPVCEGYLYFDNVHPTTAAHRLIAQQFAMAVPEPATWTLLLLALPLMARSRRRLH